MIETKNFAEKSLNLSTNILDHIETITKLIADDSLATTVSNLGIVICLSQFGETLCITSSGTYSGINHAINSLENNLKK